MLRSIGDGLSNRGMDVSIVTAQPSYKSLDRQTVCPAQENLGNVLIHRLSMLPGARRFEVLRKLTKILFPVRAALWLIFRRLKGEAPDVIVAATIPPVINGFFGLLASRLVGARFVYHMLDIYPEIGVSGGLWSRNSLRYRCLLYTSPSPRDLSTSRMPSSA